MPRELLPIVDCSNRILRLLDEEEYRALASLLRRVRLGLREVVCERDASASMVYFPCNCLLSVQTLMRNGAAVETAAIGKEGFIGGEVLLGVPHWSATVVCQVEGDCLCIDAAVFREFTAADTGLRRTALRFIAAHLAQSAQAVACNRLHKVEERFARWMLMTADRLGSDVFYLTQEFIADMLGVHRPSVSTVASSFQQAGVIRYTRGQMEILDRGRLEQASCECYAACIRQDERIMLLPG